MMKDSRLPVPAPVCVATATGRRQTGVMNADELRAFLNSRHALAITQNSSAETTLGSNEPCSPTDTSALCAQRERCCVATRRSPPVCQPPSSLGSCPVQSDSATHIRFHGCLDAMSLTNLKWST